MAAQGVSGRARPLSHHPAPLPLHRAAGCVHSQVLNTQAAAGGRDVRDALEMVVGAGVSHPGVVQVYACLSDMVEDCDPGERHMRNEGAWGVGGLDPP